MTPAIRFRTNGSHILLQIAPVGSVAERFRSSSHVEFHLWTKISPIHKNLEITTLLSFLSLEAFEPLTKIDFGGPQVLLLGSLTRFAFYMALGSRPPIGIEIFYSDGRSVSLAVKGLSLLITIIESISNGLVLWKTTRDITQQEAWVACRSFYISSEDTFLSLILARIATDHERSVTLAPSLLTKPSSRQVPVRNPVAPSTGAGETSRDVWCKDEDICGAFRITQNRR